MKPTVTVLAAIGAAIIVISSCTSQEQKDEKIARNRCASCHAFPDPKLLSKKTWEEGIFPEMAFRMGVYYSMLQTISEADQESVISTLPGQSMVTADEWESIKRYYSSLAPDSLIAPVLPIHDTLTRFSIEEHKLPGIPVTTFVTVDTLSNKVYVGTRSNKLYRLNAKLEAEDSFALTSPPSRIEVPASDDMRILLMGIMDPNDQAKGELALLHTKGHTLTTLIDSMKRPVFFEHADLSNDGLEDVVVCAFGNYTGALMAYENSPDGKYIQHVLLNVPGARKVVLRDFDNNGMIDILALLSQGDEKIVLLLNQGDFNFRVVTLLSFPPVHGSSYFDIADFNNDGKWDILYTNGDNADYSMVLKPYHGVRIFLNDGKNAFKESWSYNMHGASMALARDFDSDGDLDIAAISFFPDFRNHPEQGFIYFENNGSGFTPQITPFGGAGRWLTLEASDVDSDGDDDILLGALDFKSGVPASLIDVWTKHPTTILLLRNKTR